MKIVMLAAAAGLAAAGCAKMDYCDGTSDVAKDSALLATQKFVKDRLRAPASAQFPTNNRDPDVTMASTGPCQWTISAYVDAQNGFGALIRSEYLLVATVDEDGRYQLKNLWIDGAPQT